MPSKLAREIVDALLVDCEADWPRVIDAKLQPLCRMLEGYRDYVNWPDSFLGKEIDATMAMLAVEETNP